MKNRFYKNPRIEKNHSGDLHGYKKTRCFAVAGSLFFQEKVIFRRVSAPRFSRKTAWSCHTPSGVNCLGAQWPAVLDFLAYMQVLRFSFFLQFPVALGNMIFFQALHVLFDLQIAISFTHLSWEVSHVVQALHVIIKLIFLPFQFSFVPAGIVIFFLLSYIVFLTHQWIFNFHGAFTSFAASS